MRRSKLPHPQILQALCASSLNDTTTNKFAPSIKYDRLPRGRLFSKRCVTHKGSTDHMARNEWPSISVLRHSYLALWENPVWTYESDGHVSSYQGPVGKVDALCGEIFAHNVLAIDTLTKRIKHRRIVSKLACKKIFNRDAAEKTHALTVT